MGEGCLSVKTHALVFGQRGVGACHVSQGQARDGRFIDESRQWLWGVTPGILGRGVDGGGFGGVRGNVGNLGLEGNRQKI